MAETAAQSASASARATRLGSKRRFSIRAFSPGSDDPVSGADYTQRVRPDVSFPIALDAKVIPGSIVHARLFRSEEHTSELQSRSDLVCRLLLEKKKKTSITRCLLHHTYYS